jgi:phosphoglycolate phosphatase-like HAD superfamily hydrolase
VIDPIGVLAEFNPSDFQEVGIIYNTHGNERFKEPFRSYWHLLARVQNSSPSLSAFDANQVKNFEFEAIANAKLYADAISSLKELQSRGVKLSIASCLSIDSLNEFLDVFSLRQFFLSVSGRESLNDSLTSLLVRALSEGQMKPEETVFVADNDFGICLAGEVKTKFMLIINSYDQARKIIESGCSSAIVSLLELPNAIKLINARNRRSQETVVLS